MRKKHLVQGQLIAFLFAFALPLRGAATADCKFPENAQAGEANVKASLRNFANAIEKLAAGQEDAVFGGFNAAWDVSSVAWAMRGVTGDLQQNVLNLIYAVKRVRDNWAASEVLDLTAAFEAETLYNCFNEANGWGFPMFNPDNPRGIPGGGGGGTT